MKRRYLCVAVLLLSLLFMGIQPALGHGFPAVQNEEPPIPPEDPHIPGTLEGTGTHFALEDSEYLNITLESTEPVHLRLESVPEMIVMHLEAVGEASSTVISLGGFPPSTTYYKYEDDYHNEVAFTTDDNGAYTYTQDLSQPHLIFIQPGKGTKYIPSDTEIGTWDPVNRIYTLTTDVDDRISVVQDNLTLDGNGHRITGPGTGVGVNLYSRAGVTIKNLDVSGFRHGIHLFFSSDNTLTGNTASNNSYPGIGLYYSNNNTITGNTATNNGYGIHLYSSSGNTLTGNTASNNSYFGIYLLHSSDNTLTDNIASHNQAGILLSSSNNNTVTDNTALKNWRGILLASSSDNRVYNNNFIDNSMQAYVSGGVSNIFNLPAPTGGNHWSDWTSPDSDGDGFVDSPYIFYGGHDDLPWARRNGWKGVIPVDIDIKPGSDPNCFNVNGNGVIPVAILGSADFDVTHIDISTLSFAGLDVRVKGNDNPQCSIDDLSGDFTYPEGAPDGYADLVCQFIDNPDNWTPDDGNATLIGNLLDMYDGAPIEGTDDICIVP